jgi:uncharacterized iron-regulated membrane protein
MQRMYDNLAIALGIVASLGCVLACFYSVYHSAMSAVCWWRDTPPDQRTLWEYVRIFPNTAKVHHRKALKGLLAFLGFFLLVVVARLLLPN